MRKSIIRTIGICAGIVIIAFLIITFVLKSDQSTDLMAEYYETIKTEAELREVSGEESLLPEFYQMVEGAVLFGYGKKQALEDTAVFIVEREALFELAEKEGFSATTSEVDDYIANQINTMKSADNYLEEQTHAQKAGITLEDTLYIQKMKNHRDLVIGKYYDSAKEEYCRAQGLDIQTITDTDSQWRDYWDQLVNETITSFRQNSDTYEMIKALTENYDEEISAAMDKL